MKIFKSLFFKASSLILMLSLSGCTSGGKALSFLSPTDINEKVYVLPHKPLVKTHVNPTQPLPSPAATIVAPTVPYVIKDQTPSTYLVKPPQHYVVPADTAPVNVLGEDEDAKQRRLESNPNNAPSKDSIWNLLSGKKSS